MEFFLAVLGVVMVIEGIPWFLSPGGMKNVLRSIGSLPESRLRLFGLTLMLLGLLTVRFAVS